MAFKPIYEETLSADGNTSWVKVRGPVWVSIGHTGGTNFGGGTAKIQRKNSAGGAVDIAGEAHTVAADRVIGFTPGSVNEVRVNLASSTTPDLDCTFQWSSPYEVQRM